MIAPRAFVLAAVRPVLILIVASAVFVGVFVLASRWRKAGRFECDFTRTSEYRTHAVCTEATASNGSSPAI